MSGLLSIATESERDILVRLLVLLLPADICRLSKTCRSLHEAVPRCLSLAFHLDQRLLSFFDDPDAFRVLQSRTGAIISGSFALQFFACTLFPQADLDIYVAASARSEVGSWLLSHGYQFVARGPVRHPVTDAIIHPAQHREFNVALDVFHNVETHNHGLVHGVISIMDFHRWAGAGLRKVQVHLVMSCPLYTVLKFHSTVVMNFITFDRAYCLYPMATLRLHINLLLQSIRAGARRSVAKYDERGWRHVRFLTPDDATFAHTSVRWVCDPHAWVIPLHTPRFLPVWPSHVDPVAVATWSIATWPANGHRIHCELYDRETFINPIIFATERLEQELDRIITRHESFNVFKDDSPTLVGDDFNTQTVINSLFYILRTGKYLRPDGLYA